MVPKLELEGGASKGLPQKLVAHADAKHRLLPNDLPHILHRIWHCARVALQEKTHAAEHRLTSHRKALCSTMVRSCAACCSVYVMIRACNMPEGLLSRPY